MAAQPATHIERAAAMTDRVLAGRSAVALAPDDPNALLKLALAHFDSLEIPEALDSIERALRIAPELPDAHVLRAECLLLSGRLEEGWEEYAWISKLEESAKFIPDTEKPQWDGRPMDNGRLLLIADQGFGDVIQFSRYIPWAAALVPELVMACGTKKLSLLAQFPQLKSLHSRWESIPEWTAYLPLSALPRLCGTRLENVPAPVPYLCADPALVTHWSARLSRLLAPEYRRIGIAWTSQCKEKHYSLTLAALAPLTELDKLALVSFEEGPALTEIGQYFGHAPLLNLGPEIRDFPNTMALLECIDLLITVDDTLAHLAGAMGRPAWLMLTYAPDWRWLLGREDTPWYPSLRLFRQNTPHDWRELIERIAGAVSLKFGPSIEGLSRS